MSEVQPTQRTTEISTPRAVTEVFRTATRSRFVIDPSATDKEIAHALKALVTAARAQKGEGATRGRL